jgi:ABC-type antimicrobial peptide transport system permease subunit
MVFMRYSISLHAGQFLPGEIWVGISVWLLGIAAGLLPAYNAYKLRVAEALLEE